MLIKNYGLALLDIPIYKIVQASLLAGVPFSLMWAAIGASSQSLTEIMEGKQSLRDALPKENLELLIAGAVVMGGGFCYVLTKFGMRFREIMASIETEGTEKKTN